MMNKILNTESTALSLQRTATKFHHTLWPPNLPAPLLTTAHAMSAPAADALGKAAGCRGEVGGRGAEGYMGDEEVCKSEGGADGACRTRGDESLDRCMGDARDRHQIGRWPCKENTSHLSFARCCHPEISRLEILPSMGKSSFFSLRTAIYTPTPPFQLACH